MLLYNIPQFSGIELQPELIAALAEHDRIAGMKDSSGNLIYLQRVLDQVKGRSFQVILGSAQLLGPATSLGIRAAIRPWPVPCPKCLFVFCWQRVQHPGRGQQFADLFQVAEAVTARFGIPGLKFAMDLAGLQGGACRLPLLPCRRKRKRSFEESLFLSWRLHDRRG